MFYNFVVFDLSSNGQSVVMFLMKEVKNEGVMRIWWRTKDKRVHPKSPPIPLNRALFERAAICSAV